MLNISSTTAVSWPTPTSTAVAPVSPTAAVQPVQAGGNDGKAQTGFGRERQAAEHPSNASARAADGTLTPTSASTTASASGQPAAHDPVAKRQARQEAEKVAEQQQSKDKKVVEHLQQMLSDMWEASAAVVDRALGIEPSNSKAPGNQSDTAPDLSAVAASTIPRKALPMPERQALPAPEPLPWPVMPETAEGDGATTAALQNLSLPAEVVAYDESGNSSFAPLEAGSVIDLRV